MNSGNNGASLGMAMLTGVALLCSLIPSTWPGPRAARAQGAVTEHPGQHR